MLLVSMFFLRVDWFLSNRFVVVWLIIASQQTDCSANGAASEDVAIFKKTTVFDRISYLYNNSIISDILLTCGSKNNPDVFYAHRFILAAASPAFYESFYGKSSANVSRIHMSNVNNVTLAGVLSFIYRDECPKDTEEAFKVLALAMKLEITSFAEACNDYFQPKITPERAFQLLGNLTESPAKALANICWAHIDNNPDEFFSSEHFLNINKTTLDALLERETLCCDEITVFKAVMKWLDHQCRTKDMVPSIENKRKILGVSIYKIRFLAMEQTEFIKTVGDLLLKDVEIISIVKSMNGVEIPDLKWHSTLKRQGSCGYRLFSARPWLGIVATAVVIVGGMACLNKR